MKLNLKKLSKIIEEKTGKNIKIEKIEKIGSGYHSDGFKLSLKNSDEKFFLKKIKSHDLGFEYPERKIASILLSHSMAKKNGLSPKPLGAILLNENNFYNVPSVNEKTEIFHIQEFKSGKSYWQMLLEKRGKNKVCEKDKKEILLIVELLSKIHSKKYFSKSIERKNSVYNSSLRDILSHPELALMFMHDFPSNDPVLPQQKHSEYIGLMLNTMHKWKNKHNRLSGLHGDFWGTNVFFKENRSVFAIDYSRIPWGDPGIDVGWWLAQYLWFFHETKNTYFRDLGKLFLNEYIKKTGDKEIKKGSSIPMGYLGVVYITPKFHPNITHNLRKRFLNNIRLILQKNEFFWKA